MSPEDEYKVRECLALLQEAQGLVNRAAAALCPVPGFANEWSAAGKVYDTVKAYWYKVERRRDALSRKS